LGNTCWVNPWNDFLLRWILILQSVISVVVFSLASVLSGHRHHPWRGTRRHSPQDRSHRLPRSDLRAHVAHNRSSPFLVVALVLVFEFVLVLLVGVDGGEAANTRGIQLK
jgi:hypothetical protein